MARTKSSGRWLQEHFSDEYVKRAQKEGFRSRSVYKLMEINTRDKLFKPGMRIIDLGAAPGGWSQWLSKQILPQGRLIALDILPMADLPGVTIIQGDFMDETVLTTIQSHLTVQKLDWVLSDLAPNISGNPSIDMPRSMYLGEITVDFAKNHLKADGGMVLKAFQGEGFEALLQVIKTLFATVAIRKPKASRSRSREVYLVARGLK